MEDEECLPENSSLKHYLQNLGFSDLQITKSTPSKPSNIKYEMAKSKVKQPYVEIIDEDIIDQINIIISTQMLFEEDISNIEKLLSNFKVMKNEMLKSMFKDFYSIVVIFLGLCLYCVIGYYAFFIISSFYAFMAASYLKRKHFTKTKLKKLVSILQGIFIVLKKTIKFIEENKIIMINETNESISTEFMEGFNFYKNFKSEFVISVNEMISTLMHSTKKLINTIPLCDYIENPDYYLCNNFSHNHEFVDLNKLFEVYLLVQAEFLQRLILSLIPNIKLKQEGFELNKILTETCVSLLKTKNKLNKKFRFVFLNGIHSPKDRIDLKLPVKCKSGNSYSRDLVLNIHEASKTFQNLLLQCRILEEKIVSEKINDTVEEELVNIERDLLSCQRNISDSLILLKKANFLTKNSDKFENVKIQDEEEVRNSDEKLNSILVGYTDLDPKIEDEIFEMYYTDENIDKTLHDIEDWDLDNKLEKKVAKQYSENVLKELKLKLVEKAEYWKKRERELLMKKGIIDLEENGSIDQQEIDNFEKEPEKNLEEKMENKITELDLQLPFGQKITSPIQETNVLCSKDKFEQDYSGDTENLELINTDENEMEFDNFSIEMKQTRAPKSSEREAHINRIDGECFEISKEGEMETSDSPDEDPGSENIQKNFIQMFNRDFQNDLNQARERIFKSSFPIKEEVFYVSDEDLSSEDDPPR